MSNFVHEVSNYAAVFYFFFDGDAYVNIVKFQISNIPWAIKRLKLSVTPLYMFSNLLRRTAKETSKLRITGYF